MNQHDKTQSKNLELSEEEENRKDYYITEALRDAHQKICEVRWQLANFSFHPRVDTELRGLLNDIIKEATQANDNL